MTTSYFKSSQSWKERLQDQYWRMNNLYRIVDAYGRDIQFSFNYTQKLLYLGLWYLSIILKSRQHGITTFYCLLFLDVCISRPNIHAAIIAHNREDAEEFFRNKIKFAYDRLPAALRNAVKADRSSARQLNFSNGSSIRVTTSGRSGTYQLVHISELGKTAAKYPEKAREIVTGTLNTIHPGNWIGIESTAEGKGGIFYDMCDTAQRLAYSQEPLSMMDYKFFFFAWYLNPLNVLDESVDILDYQDEYFELLENKHGIELDNLQKAWYIKKWSTQGDDMRREHPSTVDEAFESSVRGLYYASEFKKIRAEGRITSVPYQSGVLVDTWWDIGVDDTTSIWFTQNIGREVHVINYYENSGEGLSFYKKHVLDKFAAEEGYSYGIHGAPHDLAVREWGNSAKSRYESALALGIQFTMVPPKLSIDSGIEAVRNILNICWFDETNTSKSYYKHVVGVGSLENYRRAWDVRLERYQNMPLHDWCSNGADAFRTLAVIHDFSLKSRKGFESPTIITDLTNHHVPGVNSWT